MTALRAIWGLIRNHGTKVIGVLSGVLAAVAAVPDVIPAAHLKYYMAAIAVLTYLRGALSPIQPQKQP